MKITVTEALRLKNKIKILVDTYNYNGVRNCSFGDKYVDGVIVSESEVVGFEIMIQKLESALMFSEQANNKLAMFNRESKIDALVRKMRNEKLLLEIYTQVLPKTKPSKINSFITVNNERVMSVEEYRPTITASFVNSQISKCNESIRVLQAEVENLNQTLIEFDFEYSDIEALSL